MSDKELSTSCLQFGDLPDDVLKHILIRLPVRDLLRFRCVCKYWCALIDSPSFIMIHYQLQYSLFKEYGNVPHFVEDPGYYGRSKFYLLSTQQGHVSTVDLNHEVDRDCFSVNRFCRDECTVSCFGCVNGIILFSFQPHRCKEQNCLGLWNPCTREFKSVAYPMTPTLIFNLQVFGFGYDLISDDLKILASYDILGDSSFHHQVYSLRTNSWKHLRSLPVDGLLTTTTDGYLNGVFYWDGSPNYQSEENLVIVSFNFSSEIFASSDFPEDSKPLISGVSQSIMTLYKESIGLFMIREVQEGSLLNTVDVWIVTEFNNCGVPLSWQHMFTVGPTLTKLRLHFATARMDGDLVLQYLYMSDDDEGLGYIISEEYLYNPLTCEFKHFGDFEFGEYFRYTESLYPLCRRIIEN